MSLNQVELNEIVLENLNQYYSMCSVPPVQHHLTEWLQHFVPADMKLHSNAAIDTAENCWKKIWAFKHWYMQKYFGMHVDELMKITLQPDAFRYYVLRYRNDEGRPAPGKYPGAKVEPEPNIETSEPSNLENSTRNQETGQISTISPSNGITDHQAPENFTSNFTPANQKPAADHKTPAENFTSNFTSKDQAPAADHQAPGDHQAPAADHQAPGDHQAPAADHQAPGDHQVSAAELMQQCFPGIIMNDVLKDHPGTAPAPGEDLPAGRSSE